ncbi:DUF7417 domain-containing protein [Streptomyces sp. H34-S4]|uniref:DUF7417 domain-containing protein n=1 Tax=Streptomyces sp. H34-S4 TaxID=2996463 RepID=UPI00226F66D5|nr:hypothetical protein [Streptomyces sp. H34-S4]MCY0933659.1 hypothetical protein [Streptomyces sp. H34-S4]
MGRMKDIAIDLMSFEAGELDQRETLELFATLIRSGMIWTLQGAYGRTAHYLLHEGWISVSGEVTDSGEQMLTAVAA